MLRLVRYLSTFLQWLKDGSSSTIYTVDGSNLGTVCDLGKLLLINIGLQLSSILHYEAIIGMDSFPALNVTISLNGQSLLRWGKG